jgi:hypothetical protein
MPSEDTDFETTVSDLADRLGHQPSLAELTIYTTLNSDDIPDDYEEPEPTPDYPHTPTRNIPSYDDLITILQHADDRLPDDYNTKHRLLHAVDISTSEYNDLTDHTGWLTVLTTNELGHRISPAMKQKLTLEQRRKKVEDAIKRYYDEHHTRPKLHELSITGNDVSKTYGSLDDAIKANPVHRELLLDELHQFDIHHSELTPEVLERFAPNPPEEYENEFGSIENAIQTYYNERKHDDAELPR